MKKIIFFLISVSIVLISGCGSQEIEVNESQIPLENLTTEKSVDVVVENTPEELDIINQIKFNSNLKSYEKEWLTYLEEKYLGSKIYLIKSTKVNCEGCYELSFKKDREIIKLKIFNNELKSENKVTSDLFTEIEGEEVCSLFQGTWNKCPKLCETDEIACETQCGLPVCEFDEDKIILKDVGDICGGLDHGDCKFGLTCKYSNLNDSSGICEEK